MKLIIQIPCYNEAETLALTLNELPKMLNGFDSVEYLIIDDGSTDNTVQVAKENGVGHIVQLKRNQGLAKGFMAGIAECIKLDADVIVNTDADNQYDAKCIPDIVRPILDGKADIVIGVRPIASIEHFSVTKKILQKLGSFVVRSASGTDVVDAPSGFRAISRDAAMKMNVFSNYTYTLETIIQAGQKNMAVTCIPIGVNEDLRPSRLVKSIGGYVSRSIATIIRIFIVYRPFRFFMSLGLAVFSIGVIIGGRFLIYYFSEQGNGHIQSLILASVLIGMGFQTILVAILSDLLSVNRKLLEDIQYEVKKRIYKK